jgi:hypothetical protein
LPLGILDPAFFRKLLVMPELDRPETSLSKANASNLESSSTFEVFAECSGQRLICRSLAANP